MKQRVERMSQVVRKVVGGELARLLPQAYVSGVDVSDDLRYATVWLNAVKADDLEHIEAQLPEIRPQLQRSLADYTRSKFTPSLSLRIDRGSEHAGRIDQLLGEIKKR